MKETIRKYALHNAVLHDGKASVGAVIGKIFAEDPSLKSNIKKISMDVGKIVRKINKLKEQDQVKELAKLDPKLLEKKKGKKHELPDLPGAKKGAVITRIPPEPSKYSHLGHALSFLINYLYAEKYEGKCIVRFEDTNPSATSQEYVDSISEDIKYLGIKASSTIFVSDDMNKFYKAAEKLMADQVAYVCLCSRERMQKLRQDAMGCEHRDTPIKTNFDLWEDMKISLEEGRAVLRLKLDMESLNHVLRDPAIFRIIDTPHYRQKKKYRVWPLYDFANALEDSWCMITHILRSSEFGVMRVELQEKIKQLMGFKHQHVIQYGRFAIEGAVTQGRELRAMVEEDKVLGWDDPRLMTIKALKRRGIRPESYRDLAIQVGLSKAQTNLDWNVLAALNRKHIEPEARRYFFVEDPVKIKIEGADKKTVGVPNHPDHKEWGDRIFRVHDEFYIAKRDFDNIKAGKLVRLIDCLNFKKKGNNLIYHSESIEDYKKEKKGMIIQWLPVDKKEIACDIMLPDASLARGLAEEHIKKIKLNEVIQFVRYGFCKLDAKGDLTYTFWYTHD